MYESMKLNYVYNILVVDHRLYDAVMQDLAND